MSQMDTSTEGNGPSQDRRVVLSSQKVDAMDDENARTKEDRNGFDKAFQKVLFSESPEITWIAVIEDSVS
ncbi:hypothetical protein CDAR_390011 [Caerostris darwini]|uniref:Uncharacterized protein n=1 Tax=Caerostris darwini TaxID=1538125 RepID=A0AAV4MT15_9ARAC|nr:hypothetical protein CDAR_390011 [Caerostris darwini]